MKLTQNPFYILGASVYDTRHKIMQLADDKSFTADEAQINEARAMLTNPRQRLFAEVAWLPGVQPHQAQEIMRGVEASQKPSTSIPRLAWINACVAQLDESLVVPIAGALACLKAEDVLTLINEDRKHSAFPLVNSVSEVHDALVEQQKFYRSACRALLDSLDADQKYTMCTRWVEECTDHGKKAAPGLMVDLMEDYGLMIESHLQDLNDQVTHVLEQVHTAAKNKESEAQLFEKTEPIFELARAYWHCAHPIQLIMHAEGRNHNGSYDIAKKIRNLAIELSNEEQQYILSKKLVSFVAENFVYSSELAEKLSEDEKALDDLAHEEEHKEEYARLIRLLADLELARMEGSSKKQLRIVDQIIELDDRFHLLDEELRESVEKYKNKVQDGRVISIILLLISAVVYMVSHLAVHR